MPSQRRIGRHDRGDQPQESPPHPKRPHGQSSWVVISEAQAPPTHLRAQDAILFDQVRERVPLFANPNQPIRTATHTWSADMSITGASLHHRSKTGPSLVVDRAMGHLAFHSPPIPSAFCRFVRFRAS
jgi:hypothetical protein